MPDDALDSAMKQVRARRPNVLIPETGAARYWYVDPSARGASFNPMEFFDEQGHTETALRQDAMMRRMQLLPQGSPMILKRNILRNTPRFADDDKGSLLRDIDDTFYGGGHAQPRPSPTPTPIQAPHFMSRSDLAMQQWHADLVNRLLGGQYG